MDGAVCHISTDDNIFIRCKFFSTAAVGTYISVGRGGRVVPVWQEPSFVAQ